MTVELLGDDRDRAEYERTLLLSAAGGGSGGGSGEGGTAVVGKEGPLGRLYEAHCYDERWLRRVTDPNRTSYLRWRTLVAVSSLKVGEGTSAGAGVDIAAVSEDNENNVDDDSAAAAEKNGDLEESVDARASNDICGNGDSPGKDIIAGMIIVHERTETRRIKYKKRRLTSVELFFIYVQPTHRRQGVARTLIRHLTSNVVPAEFGEATEVRLHVLEDNAVAIKFYRTLGFRTTTLKKDYPTKGQKSYRMVLTL